MKNQDSVTVNDQVISESTFSEQKILDDICVLQWYRLLKRQNTPNRGQALNLPQNKERSKIFAHFKMVKAKNLMRKWDMKIANDNIFTSTVATDLLNDDNEPQSYNEYILRHD